MKISSSEKKPNTFLAVKECFKKIEVLCLSLFCFKKFNETVVKVQSTQS